MHALGYCCTIVTNRGPTYWLLLLDTHLGILPGFKVSTGRGLPAAEVYFETGPRVSLSRTDASIIAMYQAILFQLLGPTFPASWIKIGATMPYNEYTFPRFVPSPPQFATLAFLPLLSPTNPLELRALTVTAQLICNAKRLSDEYTDYSTLSISLRGRIVATPEIGWSLYVVLGIDSTQTSFSYFTRADEPVTYTNYYATVRNIHLRAADLPLVAVIRLDDLGDHQIPVSGSWDALAPKLRFLPPELCLLLPDEFDLIKIQALRFLPEIAKHIYDIQNTIYALDKRFPNCGRVGGERYFAITVGLRLDQGRGRGLAGWRTPFGPFGVSHTNVFQRLELLGDAVLGFVVTARLLCLFPNASVGTLVDLKMELVRNETLNYLVQMLGLPQLAEFSGNLMAKSKTWADMYEELVGSVFTGPNGIYGCEEFLAKTLISPEHSKPIESACPDAIIRVLERICTGEAEVHEFKSIVDYAYEQDIRVFCSLRVSTMFLERLRDIPSEDLPDWYQLGIQFSHHLGLSESDHAASVVDIVTHLARGLWLSSPGFCVEWQTDKSESACLPAVPVLYVYHRSVQYPILYGLTGSPRGPIASKILSLCEKFLAYRSSGGNIRMAAQAISTSLVIPIPSGTIPFLIQLLQLALTPHVYQKLELLGDAFLKCNLAFHLHVLYPTLTEGTLTRMRQSAETNCVLGKLIRRFPSIVDKVITESHPKIQSDSKVYGDTFEAILAAVLLACGEEAASSFVREFVLPQVVTDV